MCLILVKINQITTIATRLYFKVCFHIFIHLSALDILDDSFTDVCAYILRRLSHSLTFACISIPFLILLPSFHQLIRQLALLVYQISAKDRQLRQRAERCPFRELCRRSPAPQHELNCISGRQEEQALVGKSLSYRYLYRQCSVGQLTPEPLHIHGIGVHGSVGGCMPC